MPAYAIDGVIPVVDPAAFVHPTAVLIGDVAVAAGCFVGPGASLRGDLGAIRMEEGSNLQDNCVMHSFPGERCILRRNGHVGHGAVLHGCIVGEGALIGMRAVIMDGAEIGDDAIVAALALVAAGVKIPARHLALGIPAKVARPLTPAEIAWKHDGTRVYQDIARRSLAGLREVAPLTAPEPNRPALRVPRYETLQKTRGKA
jgi:phenylacetic acid degradation protein